MQVNGNNPGFQNQQAVQAAQLNQSSQARFVQQTVQNANQAFLNASQARFIAPSQAMQTEKAAQVASYFPTPAASQAKASKDDVVSQNNAASMAYSIWGQMIRHGALSPVQRAKELARLYKYLRQLFPELQTFDEEEFIFWVNEKPGWLKQMMQQVARHA